MHLHQFSPEVARKTTPSGNGGKRGGQMTTGQHRCRCAEMYLDGAPGGQVGQGLSEKHQPFARQRQAPQQPFVEYEHHRKLRMST